MTGVFVIVGVALFMSPPLVGCGCPTLTQFLGFTFINLRISNQVPFSHYLLGKLDILSTCTSDLLSLRGMHKRLPNSVVSVLRRSVIMNT